LEPADGSRATRIASPEEVECEFDRLLIPIAAEKDGHVDPRIPVEDLADFVGCLPGRMAKFFSHARLLSHKA
jgi:hypothetical protein